MRVRLYLDEDAARHSLARELRLRGADVLTVPDAGMGEKNDEEQLAWASAEGRALYSYNRGDFCRLHKAWIRAERAHAGIILSRQDLGIGEQLRRLLRLINRLTSEEMINRLEFLSSWS
jgi:uncharacterized protein with PIN domain